MRPGPKPRAPNVLPLAVELFDIMSETKTTQGVLARRAGVSRGCLTNWGRATRSPKLDAIEACFNALGYDLKAVKREPKL